MGQVKIKCLGEDDEALMGELRVIEDEGHFYITDSNDNKIIELTERLLNSENSTITLYSSNSEVNAIPIRLDLYGYDDNVKGQYEIDVGSTISLENIDLLTCSCSSLTIGECNDLKIEMYDGIESLSCDNLNFTNLDEVKLETYFRHYGGEMRADSLWCCNVTKTDLSLYIGHPNDEFCIMNLFSPKIKANIRIGCGTGNKKGGLYVVRDAYLNPTSEDCNFLAMDAGRVETNFHGATVTFEDATIIAKGEIKINSREEEDRTRVGTLFYFAGYTYVGSLDVETDIFTKKVRLEEVECYDTNITFGLNRGEELSLCNSLVSANEVNIEGTLKMEETEFTSNEFDGILEFSGNHSYIRCNIDTEQRKITGNNEFESVKINCYTDSTKYEKTDVNRKIVGREEGRVIDFYNVDMSECDELNIRMNVSKYSTQETTPFTFIDDKLKGRVNIDLYSTNEAPVEFRENLFSNASISIYSETEKPTLYERNVFEGVNKLVNANSRDSYFVDCDIEDVDDIAFFSGVGRTIRNRAQLYIDDKDCPFEDTGVRELDKSIGVEL